MHKRKFSPGQSFLEFSFALVLTSLLMVGMIQVFSWTGSDLVKRRQMHDLVLQEEFNGSCTAGAACNLRQLRTTFYTSEGFNAAVPGNIFWNPF